MSNILIQEITLVKFLMDRKYFDLYYKYVKPLNVEKEIKVLLESLASYYSEYPDKELISHEELVLYNSLKNPFTKASEIYTSLFENILEADLNIDLVKDNFNYLLEQYYGSEILYTISEAIEDNKQNFLKDVEDTIENYRQLCIISAQESNESVFVTHDISSIFKQKAETVGLYWRLSCLNEHLGPLGGKSLGHVFARVDTGKTSFIISELSNWTAQLDADEYLLHCNNEEDGQKVMSRYGQSLLGVTKEQWESYPDQCQIEFEKRGGKKLLLYDKAIITIEQIEQFLIKYKVRLVVVDQADKLHFIGNKQLSDVVRLQTIYAKLRELSKKYGCDILTVGQAGVSADNKKWLQPSDIDGSKTLKPGEFDYIIGIGKIFDNTGTTLESLRYISLCKNKMGTGQHAQQEVFIDTQRAIYYDSLLLKGGDVSVGETYQQQRQISSERVDKKPAPLNFGDMYQQSS